VIVKKICERYVARCIVAETQIVSYLLTRTYMDSTDKMLIVIDINVVLRGDLLV